MTLKVKTATGHGGSLKDALEMACQGLIEKLDVLIVCAPSSVNQTDLRTQLVQRFPDTQLHLSSSSMGTMTQEGVFFEQNSVSLLAITDPQGGYGTAAGYMVEEHVAEMALALLHQAIERANRVGEQPALIWLSTAPGIEEIVVDALHHTLGGHTPIYGGSCADENFNKDWWLGDANGTFGHGVALTVFYPTADVLHGLHAGYAPTGLSGTVTKAQGRLLHTIDGRPARDVYNEWSNNALALAHVGDSILAETTLQPLGVNVGTVCDMPYYRLIHPGAVEENGALRLFANVIEGDTIMLFRGAESSIVNRASRVARAAIQLDGCNTEDISGALVTFCAGCLTAIRPQVHQVVEGLRAALPGVPFMGQFTFGEQGAFPNGENCHGNLMISVVLLRRPS